MSDFTLSKIKTEPVVVPFKFAEPAGDNAENIDDMPSFSIVGYTGAPVKIFGRKYIVDLSTMQVSDVIPVLFQHRSDEVMGQTETVTNDGKQVTLAGRMMFETDRVKQVVSSARKGFRWQASIGFDVSSTEEVKQGKSTEINGNQFEGPGYVLRGARLYEISIVSLGADGQTSTAIAAALDTGDTIMADENKNVDAAGGNDEVARNRVAMQRKNAMYDAANKHCAKFMEASLSEDDRLDAINKIAEIRDAALASDTASAKDLQLQLHEELPVPTRTSWQANDGYGASAGSQKELEARVLHSCGLSLDEINHTYGERIADACERRGPARLKEVYRAALRASNIRPSESDDALIREAGQLVQRQAFGFAGSSNISLAGILGAVANKMLGKGFASVGSASFRVAAEQADMANFQTHTVYSLNVNGDLSAKPSGGELLDANLSETPYTNKVDTYGYKLRITREMQINDDLGAFARVARQLGAKILNGVERKFAEAVAESSDSFYTSGRGNLVASNPLGYAGLDGAAIALASMLESGVPTNTQGRYILVPQNLFTTARQLFTSPGLMTGNYTANIDTIIPSANVFAGVYEPLLNNSLIDSTVDGHSTTTWYMIADPAIRPAFQIGYLGGARQPTVRSTTVAHEMDTILLQAFFDFGVAQMDHRGAVKCTA